MSQTFVLDISDSPVDVLTIGKDPESALKALISQQSHGRVDASLLFHVVNAVVGTNNNKLKRLLYYYFETMIQESEFIMCINQIHKDLSCPNEFVRGLALKLMAKLSNMDHINIPLIKENLIHSCPYVRINAVSTLVAIAIRFEIDIDQELVDMLSRESHPNVQKAIFVGMYTLSMPLLDYAMSSMEYYDEAVLDILVRYIDDHSFLKKCLVSKCLLIVVKASCKLLKQNIQIDQLKVLYALKTNVLLRKQFIDYVKYMDSSNVMELLSLIDPFQMTFSKAVLEHCILKADSKDLSLISDFLLKKFLSNKILFSKNEHGITNATDERRDFCLVLLTSMAQFVKTHFAYTESLIDVCFEGLSCKDPEFLHAYLVILYEIQLIEKSDRISKKLIESINSISYGKIIRFLFDCLSIHISKENYEYLLQKLFYHVSESTDYCYMFSSASETFIPCYVALSVASMYRKEFDCKAKAIGLILKFMEVGKRNDILDASSRSTLITVVRSLLADSCNYNSLLAGNYKPSYELKQIDQTNVLEIPVFGILNAPGYFKKFKWEESTETATRTVQMTGISDALYIECNITYSKYDCVLDLLLINQTNHRLDDFRIEYSYPSHIKLTNVNCPTVLQENSAMTVKSHFSILESSSGFITGSVYFSTSGSLSGSNSSQINSGYANSTQLAKATTHVLHMTELKINIRDFLEPTEVEFASEWESLVWENIYSAQMPIIDMEFMLQKMTKAINGKVHSKKSIFSFLVANIACATVQKNPILVNICMTEKQGIEMRVRSSSEAVVKNISGILTNAIKNMY